MGAKGFRHIGRFGPQRDVVHLSRHKLHEMEAILVSEGFDPFGSCRRWESLI